RCTDDVGPTRIGPPFEAVIARSISPASRTPTGVNSTPKEGATVWIAASPPEPAGTEGARMTATTYAANPAALVPGRDRLSTQPPPTGSTVVTNTIGTVRLAC